MTQPPEFDPDAYYGDPAAVPPPPQQPPPTAPVAGYGYPTGGSYPPYHGTNPDPWAYSAPQTGWSPYAAPTSTNGLAVGSMITGVVSLVFGLCCFLGALGGIVAVVLGFVARSQVNGSGGRQSGGGQALAGIITGGLAILIGVGFQVLGLLLGTWNFETLGS